MYSSFPSCQSGKDWSCNTFCLMVNTENGIREKILKKKTEKNPEDSSLENPSKNLSISLCEN